MRRSLPLVLMLFLAAPAWADTCGELKAAYSDNVQQFITLVTNRIQTFGSVPPNGLAWTSAPPVHPEGSGTGVTLVDPDWTAKNLDSCGTPYGLSWADVNIQPPGQAPFAIKFDQYVAAADHQVGFTLTFQLVCDGSLKTKTVNVQGSEIWREGDDWQ